MNFGDPRLPERFWSKVIPEPMSGCWLWIGASSGDGYGNFYFSGRTELAHRVSLWILERVISGLTVDHGCTTRSCVNPSHLHQVTQNENVGLAKQRRLTGRVSCSNGHPLVESNVYMATRTLKGGNKITVRVCRTCSATHLREHKQRRRMSVAP